MEDGEFLESGWFPRALVHVDVGCYCSRCNRQNIEGLQDRMATEQNPAKQAELRMKLETERELKILNDQHIALENIKAAFLRAEPNMQRNDGKLLKKRSFDGWLNNMIDTEIENEKVDVAVALAGQAAAEVEATLQARIEELEITVWQLQSRLDESTKQTEEIATQQAVLQRSRGLRMMTQLMAMWQGQSARSVVQIWRAREQWETQYLALQLLEEDMEEKLEEARSKARLEAMEKMALYDQAGEVAHARAMKVLSGVALQWSSNLVQACVLGWRMQMQLEREEAIMVTLQADSHRKLYLQRMGVAMRRMQRDHSEQCLRRWIARVAANRLRKAVDTGVGA